MTPDTLTLRRPDDWHVHFRDGAHLAAVVPWVHVDLAASEHKGGLAHVPTEFTGFGVRYAIHLLGDAAGLADRLQALD